MRAISVAALLLPSCSPLRSSAALQKTAASTPAEEADHAQLAQLLPRDAQRCVVTRPAQVPSGSREALLSVSQAGELAWRLPVPPSAYAQAEYSEAGRLITVEYLRFRNQSPEAIRAALSSNGVRWPDQPARPCGSEPGCEQTAARFLDEQTVQLQRATAGNLNLDAAPVESCAQLLVRSPTALEVSSRRGPTQLSQRLQSHALLMLDGLMLERVLRHQFADEAAAERALERAYSGQEDAPVMGGVLSHAQLTQRGAWLEQVARVSLEELVLTAEDQQRARAALLGTGAADLAAAPEDLPALLARADQLLAAAPSDHAGRSVQAVELERLLEAGLRSHPEEEGLLRRRFTMHLQLLRDPAAALGLAEEVLQRGLGNPAYWQRATRNALLLLDAERFREAAARQLELTRAHAEQLESELRQKLPADVPYEQAEWAFLQAHALCKQARSEPGAQLGTRARLPLSELPRVLAYLARLPEERERDGLTLQLVARALDQEVADPMASADWTYACGERALFLTTTSDDASLLATGTRLVRALAPGQVELFVALRSEAKSNRQPPPLRMRGNLQDGSLELYAVGRAHRAVRWSVVGRALLPALSSLQGALFPPESWTLAASSPEQALSALSAAAAVPGVSCTREGTSVRCQGSFSDPSAASRALRRAAAPMLLRDARLLWSSVR